MLKKKTRFVLGIAFALMGIFANYRSAASERGKVLQAKLSGADSILLSDLDFRIIEEAKKPKRISGSEEISQLIALLEFNDGKSGFHCMCAGDTKLEFYRGKQLLATISHHHGQSLRWHGGEWEGDSLFSKEAAKAWREWFGANDEPRFLEMHQEIVAEAERKAEIQRRFFFSITCRCGGDFSVGTESGVGYGIATEKRGRYEKETLPTCSKDRGTF